MKPSTPTKARRQENPLTQDQEEQEFGEEFDSLWRIVFSPLIWVFHFLACYIVTAIICAKEPAGNPITELRMFILGITLASLVGIALIAWRSWKRWDFVDEGIQEQDLPTQEHRHDFLSHASFLLSIVSFIGVCYVAIPSVFLDSCQ